MSWAVGVVAILLAITLGTCIGAVWISPMHVLAIIGNHLPGVEFASSATPVEETIIWQLRLPRVMLAVLVGSILATSGCAYQGTFRNPLADPYLLGVSAGASLGATVAIVVSESTVHWLLPLAAFTGALLAVGLTYSLGRSALDRKSVV